MNLFLPTKNRACQLECALELMSKNAPYINFNISLLVKTTTQEFLDGYNILMGRAKKFSNINLCMISETNFKQQFLEVIESCDKLMLMTDDCTFYNYCNLTEQDILQEFNDDVLCFSFRLGLNTTTQYYVTNQQQPHLSVLGYEDLGNLIKWDWKIRYRYDNYGYMVSWDSYLYRSKDLMKWAKDLNFYDLLTFEDKLVKHTEPRLSEPRKFMISPHISCVFANSINSVKDEPILAGTKHYFNEIELNNKYLNGEIIDTKYFDGIILNSSHEEIPIIFKKI